MINFEGFYYLFDSITPIGTLSSKNDINNVYLEMQDRLDRTDKRRISPKKAK